MIKIKFLDGSIRTYHKGITAIQIAKDIDSSLVNEVLVAGINDKICDLSSPINENATIRLYKWEDEEGKQTFLHSAAHLLAAALQDLYPKIKFGMGPSIENGFYYDVDLGQGISIKNTDLATIETQMRKLVKKKLLIRKETISKKNALTLFTNKHETYKIELIKKLKNQPITIYTQGNFTDLCKGPHLLNTSYIKAIKLTSIAGTCWNDNKNYRPLFRIYGVAFPNKKLLNKYLTLLENAKKRDHRKIGREMGLFTFSKNVGPGLPLWLPKGTQLRLNLEEFLKNIQSEYNYQQVITPHIGNKLLYVTSGHYNKYGKDSFQSIFSPNKKEEFLLKPMNCPHHCEIYKTVPRSYKELPLRLAEFGSVYRYEQSGELHGLTRTRGFTQDDAHIFCEPSQVNEEFTKVIDIIHTIFKALNFTNYEAQISLRDINNKNKYIGSDKNWNQAEQGIIEACKKKELKSKVKFGEAAFYGPKLDFIVKDALGRKWQLGTIQIDYNLPERFQLEYVGADNQKHRPVMIHRAPFGSMERFIAVLIEYTAGEFPLWLMPDQVVIIPISQKFNEYAELVVSILKKSKIRAFIDNRNEKTGKKIRDHELKKIPYLLIIGEKEVKNQEISVRKQSKGNIGLMKINTFVNYLIQKIKQQMNQ